MSWLVESYITGHKQAIWFDDFLQNRCYFALSGVSSLKLFKIWSIIVTEHEFITKYSSKLIINETKFIIVSKNNISTISTDNGHIAVDLLQTLTLSLGVAPCIVLPNNHVANSLDLLHKIQENLLHKIQVVRKHGYFTSKTGSSNTTKTYI